jgi:hypothetical protein
MAAQTWEDIYRMKDNEELYRTFKGTNNSTYAQKKIALKILEERNFKFEEIEQQKKVWKKRAIVKEKEYEKRNPTLSFLFYYRGYLLSIVSAIVFRASFSPDIFKEFTEMPLEMLLLFISWYASLLVLFLYGLIKQIKINKKRVL